MSPRRILKKHMTCRAGELIVNDVCCPRPAYSLYKVITYGFMYTLILEQRDASDANFCIPDTFILFSKSTDINAYSVRYIFLGIGLPDLYQDRTRNR